MKTGVQISIIYTDEHLIELRVEATNGVFAGQAQVYSDSEVLAEFAGVLRGFPAGRSDSRAFEIGTFDAAHAGGGAGFRLYCVDSVGHAVAEVRLRGGPHPGGGESDAVVLHIPVEAAAIDSFVEQLERMAAVVGQSALLEPGAEGMSTKGYKL